MISAAYRSLELTMSLISYVLNANSGRYANPLPKPVGGSVAERLACWTQEQKGLGSNRSRDAVG